MSHGSPASDDEDSLTAAIYRLGRLMNSRQVAGRIVGAADAVLSQQGLQVVRTLHRHGQLPVAVLAGAADMDVAAVSRQLKLLEPGGLVTRSPSPGDARVVLVALTESGREIAERIRRVVTSHLHASLRSWSVDDRRELGHLLGRLVEDLQVTPIVPP